MHFKYLIALFFVFICSNAIYCMPLNMQVVLEVADLGLKIENTFSSKFVFFDNARGLPFITLVFDQNQNIIPDNRWAAWFAYTKQKTQSSQNTISLPWQRVRHELQPFESQLFPLSLAGTIQPMKPNFDLVVDGKYYVICVMRNQRGDIKRTVQTSNLVEIVVRQRKIISFKELDRSTVLSKLSDAIDKEIETIKSEAYSK